MNISVNTTGKSLNLPRDYLSYSALSLWTKNKDAFRKKYYEGVEPKETRFSLFGKEVHSQLEHGALKKVPRYKEAEFPIKTEIEGVPVYGIIDSFDPRGKRFLDFKSGIRKPDGSPRWDDLAVISLDQLPFYSLMIETMFGRVHPLCKLIWLETRSLPNKGRVSVDDARLVLTGDFHIFKRVIEPWERERMREWIVTEAEAISKDRERYIADTQ